MPLAMLWEFLREEALELADQGLLFDDQTLYNLAWQAMRQHLTLTPIENAQFVLSHRILDLSIDFPVIQRLSGPLQQQVSHFNWGPTAEC